MSFNLASKPVFFLTKLVTLGILFSTTVNAGFVAKLLISGILFSTAVKADFLTRSLTSGIFLSTLSILSSKALVSVLNLVLVKKLLVSTVFVLSIFMSAKLSKAFLFTAVIHVSISEIFAL